jgi:DNA-binding response OmpR family regulator
MTKTRHVIVVADDNPATNDFLQELLSDEGYDVLCSFTGEEAWRIIARVIPDLAIIDMQMETQEDGFILLQRMRKDATTAHIAVIICSADVISLQKKYRDIIDLHAKVMTKPFDIDYLLRTVERLVGIQPA